MIWIFNNTNFINFYQVFTNTKIEFNNDLNSIYSLIDDGTEIISQNFEIYPKKYEYTIKIIDQYISYTDNNNYNQNVFSFKTNFIDPESNEYKIPIFKNEYKRVNNNLMPNLIKSNYNFYGELKFTIYKIDNNIQYVIETDPKTNITRKYFITTDLQLLNNYIIK